MFGVAVLKENDENHCRSLEDKSLCPADLGWSLKCSIGSDPHRQVLGISCGQRSGNDEDQQMKHTAALESALEAP